MPFSRYFYAPAIVLFLLPIGTRRARDRSGPLRRRARAALPILLGGALLWLAASPALRYAATGDWGEAIEPARLRHSFFRPFNAGAGDAETAAFARAALSARAFRRQHAAS